MVSISAAGADIYEFFDPDGYDPDNPTLGILGSANPITVTPSVSGYYTVKGTDTATGCVGIDSIYIHINPFDPGAIGFNYTATGAPRVPSRTWHPEPRASYRPNAGAVAGRPTRSVPLPR